MSTTSTNLEIAQRYLQAIEQGATGATLAAFFAPDVVQEEFPNRLLPQGTRRDLAALLDGAERGQKVLSGQRYEIQHELVNGNFVAFEVIWLGTLAIPLGALAVGDNMRAHFAVFLEFRDGKILAQRNYDCFDPW
ncbi:hypothetical protein BH10CHL1_BH10CHL1_26430 [soil metagenome]